MTRTITLHDFLTEEQIRVAALMYQGNAEGFAKRLCDEIVAPNIETINKALGQENDPMYLSYAVEYVLSKVYSVRRSQT